MKIKYAIGHMNPSPRRGLVPEVDLASDGLVTPAQNGHSFKGARNVAYILLGVFFCGATALVAQNNEKISPEEASNRLRGRDTRALPRQSVEVGSLKNQVTTVAEARVEAGRILTDLLLTGGSYEATHVMTYVRLTGDRELVTPIRQRLAKNDSSWGEQHVKLGAMHALVVLENEKFPSEIREFLKSDDPSLKVRAFMLVRDSGDASLIAAVQEEVNGEQDSSVKAAGLSALAVLEGQEGASKSQLQAMAATEEQAGSRARIELVKSGNDPPLEKKTLSREEEEKFKQMAVSDRHDERMFAIEEIAKHGSEGARGWLRRLGEKEDWKVRMTSAYYLLLAGEREEAQKRLAAESQPLVQITLLAALRTTGGAQ